MKKLLTTLGALATIPAVFAVNPLRPLEDIGQWVFTIGSFEWVQDKFIATKFALFIILFALFYWILVIGVKGSNSAIFKDKAKNSGIVIAFALSTISIIVMPSDLITGIGELYSGIFAIILIGFPVFGILALGIIWTRKDSGSMGSKLESFPHNDNAIARHAIRLLTALIALSIISGVAVDYGVDYTLSSLIPLLMIKKNIIKQKNKE